MLFTSFSLKKLCTFKMWRYNFVTYTNFFILYCPLKLPYYPPILKEFGFITLNGGREDLFIGQSSNKSNNFHNLVSGKFANFKIAPRITRPRSYVTRTYTFGGRFKATTWLIAMHKVPTCSITTVEDIVIPKF